MRVTLDASTAGFHSGLRRYTTALARALAESASACLELQLLTSGRRPRPGELPPESHWVRHRRSALPGRLPPALRQDILDRVVHPLHLRRHRSQVYHSPYLYRPRVPAARVLTIHDLIPLRWPELVAPAYRAWFERHVTGAAGWADVVVCGSEYTRQDWIRWSGMDPERVVLTPYGVDECFFRQEAPRDPGVARRELGLPERYVLYAGDSQPRKNLPRLVRAYSRAVAGRPGFPVLVLAGRRSEHSAAVLQLAAAVGVSDRVRLLDEPDDGSLCRLIDLCEAFVYPSLCEGFGLPPLEAMARGRPVLTSSATSLPEVCGDAALLVDPEDETALTEGLVRMLEDEPLRVVLAERARTRASGFRWSRTAETTIGAYRLALGRAGSPVPH